MDWQCGEWKNCINGLQTRECNFVKVPQHVQDTECPISSNAPTSSQKCEMPKLELAAETCTDSIKNQNEEGIDCGGVCKPCAEGQNLIIESDKQKEAANQISGFAVKEIADKITTTSVITAIALVSVVIILFYAVKFFKRK